MPRGSQFSKRARESVLGRLAGGMIGGSHTLLDALTFIEGDVGLKMSLYPVQRVLLKCFFGIPLNTDQNNVPVWDVFREKKIYTFTEAEYLSYVFNEGRTNIEDWRDIPSGGFNDGVFFVGRRGGKSEITAAIGAYALYCLLNVRSPQEYYKLVPGSPIDLTFMAQDDVGSNRLYKKLQEHIGRPPSWFDPYIRGNGADTMTFVSEADREKTDATPSITVASYPCTTSAVRGPSSIFLAFDEFAHFRSETGSSSDEVYDAATPATLNFVNPDEERDSQIVCISSPWKKVGKMFELYQHGMNNGLSSGTFVFRCSTAEMNPRADSATLRKHFTTQSLTWKAEYGGQFLESSESYVTEAQIKACTDVQWDEHGVAVTETARFNVLRFHPKFVGYNYFWGIDMGGVNVTSQDVLSDATALAIGHLEFMNGNIFLVYDYIDRMMVSELFEGPGVERPLGVRKYENFSKLPLDDVLDWLSALNQILPCFKGATDQHAGQQLITLLAGREVRNIELKNLTPGINSKMAFALKGRIDAGTCRFPYQPKFIQELKMVEAEYTNKYQIHVRAPEEKGAHDDMVDAAEIVAMLATDWLIEEGGMLLDPTGQSFIIQQQMMKSPAPVLSTDAVSIQDLKILERMRRIQQGIGVNSGFVQNPWNKRSGHRGPRGR